MSTSKAATAEHDPVLASFENAPLDSDAVTEEEREALRVQLGAAEDRRARSELSGRSGAEVIADLAERAKHAE